MIFVRNDNTVLLKGVKDSLTGAYIDDADVTWEVRTAKYPDGEVVEDGDGEYVDGSNGDYEIDLDDALSIEAGTKYSLRVMAETSAGKLEVEDYFTTKARTGRTPTT